MRDEDGLRAGLASAHACAAKGSRLRVSARSWAARVVLLAAAYFAAAKLGLLLAIPTIYASPFWPASGIALAGLLILGYRAWPGVFIGCLLPNIGTLSLAAAASVAAGASMQALAGAFLVRKFIQFPSTLDNGRDVIKFMFLAGPLSSWVNATCGVSTLVLAGFMPADDFGFNWWTWWVGDSIGALVVTPLVLAWAGEPRESWRQRRVWLTVPVFLASAIAVAFFIPASWWERDRLRGRFEESATSTGDALKSSTNRYLEVLESVKDLHESSTDLTWPEFRRFVAGPLARYPGFQAISWNPRIPASARAESERRLQRDGFPGIGLTERDDAGRLILAAPRSEYVFVRYIEPYEGNQPALGYDVASNPRRLDALDRARDSGQAIATAQVELVQDMRREPAVLVFTPVYRKGYPRESQDQRRTNLIGYMTGVFRISDVVASSLENLQHAEMDAVLRDGSAAAEERPLYASRRPVDDDQRPWVRIVKTTMAKDVGINFAGRQWVLSVSPTWGYMKKHRSWQAWTVLAGGMLCAALIGAFLLVITGGSTRSKALAGRLQLEAKERREAQERVQRLNRVYAVLSGINALIVRVRDRAELYSEACRVAIEAGNLRMAWLGVYDRQLMRITPVARHGNEDGFLDLMALSMPPNPVPEGLGLVRRAVLQKEPVIINDIERDDEFRLRTDALARGYRSATTLPLIVGGEVIGVWGLFASEPGFFDADEMRLLSELAGDISFALEHIAKTERLDYLAYYDPLTGLANRALFQERLSEHARIAEKGRDIFAVCVLDVDRFKLINDAHGRQMSDALLEQITRRMTEAAGDESRLARIHTDRFALVISNVQSEDDVARRVERTLQVCFGPPFDVQGQELSIPAKIGVALFPSDGTEEESLLANAEAALNKAKAIGARYLFHTPEMAQRIAEKLLLENRLRHALDHDEFVLHYQPKVDLTTRRVVGLEALIRWQSPERGLVPPRQFMPLLEETGLILDVGAWALRKAISDQRNWIERGLRVPRVAVNVSGLQLRQRNFVAMVSEALHQCASSAIDLELTESLLKDDIEDNIEKLKAIRSFGVGIAIDDFGTGHSSLACLAKLPVDMLKIDRAFISAMLNDPPSMTLVQTVISLAHSLKLKVVAGGVEAEDQALILRLLRCDQMQGYLVSKPLPREEIVQLLSHNPQHDEREDAVNQSTLGQAHGSTLLFSTSVA